MCDPFHMHNLDAVFTKEQKTEWRREMCPADLSVGTAPNPSHVDLLENIFFSAVFPHLSS